MGLFGLEWKDVASGVASGVGFAFGGPVGSAILGGAVSGIWTGIERGSFSEGLQAGLVGAAFSAIPGGVVGGATRGLTGNGLRALGNSFRDVPDILSRTSNLGGFADRLAFSRAHMNRLGAGALTAGLGNALASRGYDVIHPKPSDPAKVYEKTLPTKILNESTTFDLSA
ncbi:hypothetical protein IU479_15975 [Nocardia abscessus]|uniref:hypothetical protein n=1 Tax=Nocardia TaxID=1817 RepID=UPI0018930E87|nr:MULTISPECIES: hypothetical protein [Nocardia]MBF6219604.1 hypothetical protein [Nocardia abscessus]MDE1673395.1 hypothetical protein [Nocardia gipuzkoensis]